MMMVDWSLAIVQHASQSAL